ncbi:hypothetical protein OPQ81_008067 [Rhizoctonia solani]|nr:hypothetical protein OPQ81_008067 [Rhizoctonia solani]
MGCGLSKTDNTSSSTGCRWNRQRRSSSHDEQERSRYSPSRRQQQHVYLHQPEPLRPSTINDFEFGAVRGSTYTGSTVITTFRQSPILLDSNEAVWAPESEASLTHDGSGYSSQV